MVYLCLLSEGILGEATVFICCLHFQIFLGLPYGNRVPVLAFVVWPVSLGEVSELERPLLFEVEWRGVHISEVVILFSFCPLLTGLITLEELHQQVLKGRGKFAQDVSQ